MPAARRLILAAVFVISIKESMNPENASGASLGGIGLVFFMGFGLLLLGAVLMLIMRVRSPAFFTDRSLRNTPVPETAE